MAKKPSIFDIALGNDGPPGKPRPWRNKLPDGWETCRGTKFEMPELSEKQWAFINSTSYFKGYGGSPNSGKTTALIVDMVRAGMTQPGMLGACLRYEYSAAERSVVAAFTKYVAILNEAWGFDIKISHGVADCLVTFPTGARIEFFGAKDDRRVQGGNYTRLWLEEATQLPDNVIGMITRTFRGEGFTKKTELNDDLRIVWSANAAPGWFFDNFVVPYCDDKLPKGWEFFPAFIYDNPHYVAMQEKGVVDYDAVNAASYGPEEWHRMTRGSVLEQWSASEGSVYPTLLETDSVLPYDRHVIEEEEFINYFGGELRPDEPAYFGFDHGVDSPCGLLLGVVRDVPSKGPFLIIFEEWGEPLMLDGVERTERFVVDKVSQLGFPVPLSRIQGGWDCCMKHKIYSKAKTFEERNMDPRKFLTQLGLNGHDMETRELKVGIRSVRKALNFLRIKFLRKKTEDIRREIATYQKGGAKNPPGEEDLPLKTERRFHKSDALRYLVMFVCGNGLLGDELLAVPESEDGVEITYGPGVKEETLVAMRDLSYSTPPSAMNRSRSVEEMTTPRVASFPSSLSLRRL